MKLAQKFVLSLVAVGLLCGPVAAFVVNSTLEAMEQEQLPLLQNVEKITRLSRVVQAESLEFVASSEEEAIEQHTESSAALISAIDQLSAKGELPAPVLGLTEAARNLDRLALR